MTTSKIIKQLLAFLMAFAIMLPVSVPLTAKANESSSVYTKNAEDSYNFLKAVGAMDSDEVPFDADMQITRAHFVKLALHLSNDAPNVLLSDDEVFYDVNPSTDYENYIETAYRIGYISGSASGLFEPEKIITLPQALKILCNILGYDRYAQSYGGYPTGYLVCAQKADLLDGVSISGDSVIDMANAVILLENAAKAEIMQIVSIGEDIELKTADGESLLYKNHGVDYISGVVNADSYTNLLSCESKLSENQLSVDDVCFNIPHDFAKDALGYHVNLYFDISGSSPVKNALYSEITESNALVFEALPENLEISDNKISVYDDNDNVKALKISDTASYILNGKMTVMNPEDLLDVKKGKVTFVSNDDDRCVDVIKITKYETAMVNGVSASSGIIVTNDGARIYLEADDDSYSFDIVKNGSVADLSSIKVNDVLLISEGKGRGYRHISIVASDKVLTGAIQELGEDYAIISGEKYPLDSTVRNNIKTGVNYKIYLDAYGNVCYVANDADVVYGFLYAVGKEGMNKPKCLIFTENNRWVELFFADKVKYNGKAIAGENLYSLLMETGDDYKQLVRYNVNSVPELASLETCADIPIGAEGEKEATENNIFRKSYSGSLRYRNSPKSFNGVFFVDPDAKIFNIPADLSKDQFVVRSASVLKTDTAYNITAYNVDRYLTSGVLTTPDLSSDNEILHTDKFMIVKGKGQIVNSEGDASPSIVGYWDGVEISFPVKIGDLGVSDETYNALEKGDVILFKFDDDSNITSVTEYPSGDVYYTSTSTLYTTCSVMGGVVSDIDITGKKIRMTYSENGSELGVIYTTSTSAAIWNSRYGIYSQASVEDIIPGDKIFINTRYLNCYDVIIIRE